MKIKKILISMLIASLSFGLASCKPKDKNSNNNDTPNVDNGQGDNTNNDNTGGNTGNDNTGSNDNTGGNTGGDNTGSNDSTGGNTGNDNAGSNDSTGGNTGNDNTGSNDSTGGSDNTPVVNPDDFTSTESTSIVADSFWSSGSGSGAISSNVNNGTTSGALKLGSSKITKQGDIVISSSQGLYEAAYVEFNKHASASGYVLYYKQSVASAYQKLEYNNLYLQEISGKMRADIMGLKAGSYDVKIVPILSGQESESNATILSMDVVAYDRSGYAHFKYTDGVGAYNDDGTLKDNAIVIYVTNDNKDTIMSEIVKKYSDVNMFNIPSYFSNSWNNKEAAGIGWWMNNAQYTKCTKNSSGVAQEAKSSNTYSPEGQTLGFYSVTANHPLVIRFVGTVETPEGLTAYDSYAEGGSEGDNGHMARMKDLNNVTLEGVGFDAAIKGWGIHFMCSDRTGVRGKSFEVRNLTFTEYPEDALGMEGVQEGSEIVASVERCWVHHNTFLPGYCASPAESDKAEGDGSCDFKRGRYYTMSYCYYENCHKTNLIGSSDSSLQYDISFHHNLWNQCGSRMPLLRRANIHFYNNYVVGDPTNSVHKLSYVTSLRADCYMYSENNYYEGCKQVFDETSGAKCYGNTYLSCFQSPGALACMVSSREDAVANNCKYLTTDYFKFDTDPNLFYYNTSKKESDCYLTTSTIAKQECINFSGSFYRTILNNTTLPPTNKHTNNYTIDTTIDLSSGSYNAVIGTNSNGILYTNVKNNKFKGQGITFRLADYARCTIEMTCGSSASLYDGFIVKDDGDVKLCGSGSCILEPGLYFISPCQLDKETTVTSLIFEKYNDEGIYDKLIETYNEYVELLPTDIKYDKDSYEAINKVIDAYKSLPVDERAKLDNSKVNEVFNKYLSIGKAYTEALIEAIGTVDENSGSAINNAKKQLEKIKLEYSGIVIENESALMTASQTFEAFAITSCINKINAIGTITVNSKNAIETARTEYDLLTDAQKEAITNYSTLTSAEKEYAIIAKVDAVEKAINGVDLSNSESMKNTLDLYNALTDTEKSKVSNSSSISNIKVNYTIVLIDSIGTVNESSGAAIKSANNAYNQLSSAEKQAVTNYSKLESANAYFDTLVVDNTISWSNTTEAISSKTGTTLDGFTYAAKGVEDNSPKLRASDNNHFTSKTINAISASVTITGKMADTSSENEITIICTYNDNTTEVKTVTVPGSKSASAGGTVEFVADGKTITNISITGSQTNASKNFILNSVVIVYKA